MRRRQICAIKKYKAGASSKLQGTFQLGRTDRSLNIEDLGYFNVWLDQQYGRLGTVTNQSMRQGTPEFIFDWQKWWLSSVVCSYRPLLQWWFLYLLYIAVN